MPTKPQRISPGRCCAGLCFLLCLFIGPSYTQQAQRPVPVLQSGHASRVIALRADGQLAVTGGRDGQLKWWDRETGLLIRSVPAHNGSISTVSFNERGNLILSGGEDGLIQVWDAESGQQINSFRASKMLITYATFSPDSLMIASCGPGVYDPTSDEPTRISLWNAITGTPIRTLRGHTGEVNHLDFNSRGDTLVSASDDKTLKVWSVATGQPINTIPTDSRNVFVAYSPDGGTIAAVMVEAISRKPAAGLFMKPTIGFFNAQVGTMLRGFSDSEYWGEKAISANWRYFVATTAQGFKVWSTESGELVRFERLATEGSGLAVSADGSTLAFGGASSPSFWPSDYGGGTRPATPFLSFTTGLAVSPDHKLVAWGGGTDVYVWDKSAAVLRVLKGHNERINEVVFSPDSSKLASCSNNVVKLWSTSNGSPLGELTIPRSNNVLESNWNGSQSVSFSPDGELIATGETKVTVHKRVKGKEEYFEYVENLGIRVWDVRTRGLIKFFPIPKPQVPLTSSPGGEKNPPYWIRSIAFSPNKRMIASDNGATEIILLDINTGKLRHLYGHNKEINSVAFSSDGKRLVSGSFDNTVRLWNVASRLMIGTAGVHNDRVTSVEFSRDDRIIISGSRDRTMKLWDANGGTNLATLENHDKAVTSVGVSADGKIVFSTSMDGKVSLWSLDGRTLVATLAADSDGSWVCFSPDGYYMGRDAEKYLAWRVGNEMYPASKFQAQFSKSDVLLTRLNGLPLGGAVTPKPTPLPKVVARPTPQPTPAQPARGGDIRVRYPDGQVRNVELYKQSYALLIGNSDYNYNEAWADLPGVQLDMHEVKRALEKQGFKVVSFDSSGEPLFGQFVINVTRAEFRRQLELFVANYGQDEENRLLIYYAGHGYTAQLPDRRKMGYLVMRDAPRMPPVEDALQRPLSSQQLNVFYRASVNMDEMETYAKNITARHALFVFDSCFSGTVLFRDADLRIPPYINQEVIEPVREFLTAGSEKQRVRDDSPFRKAFVRGIEGAADASDSDNPKDGYILASELYAYIRKEVIRYTDNQQTPVFGKIVIQELARGDFVFAYAGTGR
jgi:WD40 repeat protein